MMTIIIILVGVGVVSSIIKGVIKLTIAGTNKGLEVSGKVFDTISESEYIDPNKVNPISNLREDRIRNDKNIFVRNNEKFSCNISNKISTH